MKQHKHPIQTIITVAALAALPFSAAQAQTIDFMVFTKEVFYWQGNPNAIEPTPTQIEAAAFIEDVEGGTISNARLITPESAEFPLIYNPDSNEYVVKEEFDTIADINEDVPNGTYRIAGTGSAGLGDFDVSLSLSGNFPTAPFIVNYSALQQTTPSQGVTVQWNPMDTGAAHRFIQVFVSYASSPGNEELYESGLLDGSLTSHTIPPGVLPDGATLQLEIGFIAASQFVENGPGGATTAAAYITATELQFPTSTPPLDPALAFFGADLYIYPGTTPGTNAWYFSYTFKDLYHFAGDNWFFSRPFNSMLYVETSQGSLASGFWSYFIFPEGNTSWGFMGRDGNFYDLRDTNKDGAPNIPDSEAGDQTLSGFIYLETPFPGDPEGPGWYYFEEFPNGNYIIKMGPVPGDWHKLL